MVEEVSADWLRATQAFYGPDHPETDAVLEARVRTVVEEERQDPRTPEGAVWWLSFADESRGFLGVAIVEGNGPASAMQNATELGINPGGGIMSFPVPGEHVPAQYRNRLLTRAEAAEVDELSRPA